MRNDPGVLSQLKNTEQQFTVEIKNEKGKTNQTIWCYPEYKRPKIERPMSTEGEDFDDMMTDERIMA